MKHNKYNASKMRCKQGHIHNSKKEAWRCNEQAMTYIADFEYIQDGVKVVEDVKSEATKKDKLYIAKRNFLSGSIAEIFGWCSGKI